MKKIGLLAVVILFTQWGKAQESQPKELLAPSFFGVQAGFLGMDIYNEMPIADKIALRSGVGFLGGIWGGTLHDKTGFALYPVLNVEPKYYYNIDSRAEKGKNTKNNSGNYISLATSFVPNWFTISNAESRREIKRANKLFFIPTFGIRRNFAENFNYEFKVGYGYGISFGEGKTASGMTTWDLGFKVGYDF